MSEFNLQVFIADCCVTIFSNLENFVGKQCVEMLNKCSGLKVLLLNLEVVSGFVSYGPQHFQIIYVQATIAKVKKYTRSKQEKGKGNANDPAKLCGECVFLNTKCKHCPRTFCTCRMWRDRISKEFNC